MAFLAEIKRRKVFQVAVVYAVVAWLLVQIVATIEAPLSLPAWVDTLVIVLLGVGFPVVLIVSWAFDITKQGLVRDVGESGATTSGKGARTPELALIGVLVLGVAFLFVDNYLLEHDAATEDSAVSGVPVEPAAAANPTRDRELLPNSVAVLPLDNLSPDPDNAYVAAGLHEEILNQLAKLRNLNVIARTSVLRFEQDRPPIEEIAAMLNVESVMEGSIRYAGNRIRVTTQLIDAATGAHLWSETYDREFDDIFAIESDIAMNVANALRAEFSLAEQERIETAPTDSPAAYAALLRGLDAPDIESMHRHLDRAIELDPEFALAYAYKGMMYMFNLVDDFTIGAAPRSEQTDLERLARENAQRALEIDPNQPRAYLAIAEIEQMSWHWAEARRAFERALSLSPNDSPTLARYVWHNSYSGRHAEAIAAAERLVDLEASPGAYYRLGTAYGYAGDLEAARRALAHSFELDQRPGGAARLWLLQVLVGLGERDAALEQLEFLEESQPARPSAISVAGLAYAYGRLGRTADAARLFANLEAMSQTRPVGAGSWVLANLAVGNIDEALEWLQAGIDKMENHQSDEGYFHLMAVKTNGWADPRLDEPAFRRLRDRMDALDRID